MADRVDTREHTAQPPTCFGAGDRAAADSTAVELLRGDVAPLSLRDSDHTPVGFLSLSGSFSTHAVSVAPIA
jgi:hypothetical protein